MIKIAPSILASDFSSVGKDVKQLKNQGADWVHCDIMDGHFVPNITFGPQLVRSIRPLTDLPFDVHLMVDRPSDWIELFSEAGADCISFHVEAENHIHRQLQHIHSLGKKAGVALNPSTSLTLLEDALPYCDYVLLMTVNPGFGGQKFIDITNKIRKLKEMIDGQKLNCEIEVDGGINPATAKQCIDAGASILVAGNNVFHSQNRTEAIRLLRC